MSKPLTLPEIPEQLLKALEARYPNKLPDGLVSEAQLALLIGQQRVVQLLRRTFEQQQRGILVDDASM